LGKLQEITSNGNVVASVNQFASSPFTWTAPTSVNINNNQNNTVTQVQFTDTITVKKSAGGGTFDVPFSLKCWIAANDFTTTFAGEIVNVKKGQLKFTIDIQDWAFASSDNKLQFSINVLTPGSANNDTTHSAGTAIPGTKNSKAYLVGNANVYVPMVALVDGNSTAITTSFTQEGGNLLLNFIFPSFENELIYDPTLAVTDLVVQPNNSPAMGMFSNSFNAILFSLVLSIAAIVVNKL